ncbi:MAG TPA: BACON domain-containing carbohydrate-binding protein [Vicinamibacterales bacterium]|nr:BACON domain-containing carbohydrate-binding protein [Vicinamibacterales bacterium]
MKVRRCLLLVVVLWLAGARAVHAQCTYTVTPTTLSVLSTGTSRTVSVTTGTQCSWTAVSHVSWIHVTSGSGTGLGSAVFTIDPNPTSSPRTGTLTIAGHTVTVNQAANSCTYSVTPLSFSLGSLSVQRTISVTTGTACTWTAVASAAWITITSGATGSAFGSVVFVAAANTGPQRTGTITIGDKVVSITQAAGSGSSVPPAAPTNLRIVQ